MSEELNYKRQCPFCDGVIDFDIDYCESYEIGEDTVNLWGYCNKCDYDGHKEFQAWGGGWQKAEKEIERYKTVEPTINTFEELAENVGVVLYKKFNTSCFDYKLNSEISIYYTEENVFQIIDEKRLSHITLYITPKQAYNIITCLKTNLGG